MNRILFVDDDPQVLRTFERMFPAPQYAVDTAEDGPRALSMLEQGDHDVVLADYQMPEMNGGELLARVKAMRPDAVRFLVTGTTDFRNAVDAVNKGEVFRLVRKPWDEEELRFSVRLALEMNRLAREREALKAELADKNQEEQRAHRRLLDLQAQIESRLHRRTVNLLDALTAALDMRDNETQLHSRRVSSFAARLAMELGLDEATCRIVEEGALLHDIGKIGVPDAVLLKPGKLTDEEWVVMKRHPEIGRDLLRTADFLDGAREIVAQHQERYDGLGYPLGLKRDEICIGARIFAVVDTFDAITSDRPYRKAQSYEAAIKEIERCAGTQLDPDVVAGFLRVPESVWDEIRGAVCFAEERRLAA